MTLSVIFAILRIIVRTRETTVKPQRAAIFMTVVGLSAAIAWAQPTILNVWPHGVPGSIPDMQYTEESATSNDGIQRISKISNPTLTIFLPPKENAKGTAIVVCPGGGYSIVAINHEGYGLATWMNNAGIACIVLKYRLPDDAIMMDRSIGPLQDVQEAIRIVRRNADAWGLDPHKIGVMGFSAGGHLAATASTLYNDNVYESDTVSARPDFSVLLYPVISMQSGMTHGGSRQRLLGTEPDKETLDHFSNELQVTGRTPMAFLVHSADDKSVPVQNSITYALALKQNAVPVELHIFEKGGHGYGLAATRTSTESQWPALCLNWLRMHGIL